VGKGAAGGTEEEEEEEDEETSLKPLHDFGTSLHNFHLSFVVCPILASPMKQFNVSHLSSSRPSFSCSKQPPTPCVRSIPLSPAFLPGLRGGSPDSFLCPRTNPPS
jgi:hypothetical protein